MNNSPRLWGLAGLLLAASACASLPETPAGPRGTAAALAKVPPGTTAASGAVFLPNPVQTTGIQTLTDQKDSDAAVPESAYFHVPLMALDGSGFLSGRWASVRSETGPAAYSSTGEFDYSRHDDRFEQVMAYFWVTEAQLYLQGLGFGTGDLKPVNMEAQDVRINQWGQDNSYSWEKHDVIRLGKGGVDDAEDGEVIVHEYGHAVHDSQVPGFGASAQAGAIGEGFGDYLAVTVGLAVAAKYGAPAVTPAACVADWDAVAYTTEVPHCLRRVDSDRTMANLTGRVHADGMIWSRALWDIREALGATRADRIIVNAQFRFAPDTSFAAAADATVATALGMYDASAAAAVRAAFEARGIL